MHTQREFPSITLSSLFTIFDGRGNAVVMVINSSQTKVLAIILVLLSFLCDFLLERFFV